MCEYQGDCNSDYELDGCFLCQKLVEMALSNNLWKEKAHISFIPNQEKCDEIKYRIKISNPYNYFGIEKICSKPAKSVFVPLMTWEKPILNNEETKILTDGKYVDISVPGRVESGIKITSILIKNITLLDLFYRKYEKQCSSSVVKSFITSLIICSTNRKRLNSFQTIKKYMSVHDYKNVELEQYLCSGKYYRLKKHKEAFIKKWYCSEYVMESFERKSLQSHTNLSNDEKLFIELYSDLLRLLRRGSSFIDPIVAYNDFIRMEPEKTKTFIFLYEHFLLFVLRNIKKVEKSTSMKSSLIILKDLVALNTLIDERFLVLVPVPIEQKKIEIVTSAKSYSTVSGIAKEFSYIVNLSLAKSKQISLISEDMGYYIAHIDRESENFFGREFRTKNAITLVTRKTSVFNTNCNSFIDNIVLQENSIEVNVRYKLNRFYESSLILAIVYLGYSILSGTVNISSLILPLTIVLSPLMFLGKWSVTHYLLKPYKLAVGLLTITQLILIISKEEIKPIVELVTRWRVL
jgi:hypothetical protein